MLSELRGAKVRVLVVWEPILPTDWRRPTTSTLARISDARAMQFWDPHHLVSAEIKRNLAATGVAEPGHSSSGHLWDFAVLYPAATPAAAGNPLPAPAFFDGPVVDVATDLEKKMHELSSTPPK